MDNADSISVSTLLFVLLFFKCSAAKKSNCSMGSLNAISRNLPFTLVHSCFCVLLKEYE